ncbi:alpha/beta hydrolase [Pseudonocardia bannensis]|uniref:Alpha/beta hydrolase n=1 Tax=Pseudonocardia bannensis TaxID=630973 RepID=A0A848DE05_9PSEU|nr:alpha/beta hydrolase [Pseudonocardia bannensis]NMH90805.1 alpha/beta hydrolase [Pseudonocardia bannensis]
MIESLRLRTADGLGLEAEVASPGGEPRAAMVLCHPHPQYGGSMRTVVIDALFGALPAHGVACLRFNFRGVEGSDGGFDDGTGERLDVEAAVTALDERLPAEVPLVLAGWSFGADMALSVRHPRLGGWYAIAPPLRFARDLDRLATDPRPKLLALAERDEVRPPAEVARVARDWTHTEIEIVPGASHFFLGHTGRLVDLGAAFADRLARWSRDIS